MQGVDESPALAPNSLRGFCYAVQFQLQRVQHGPGDRSVAEIGEGVRSLRHPVQACAISSGSSRSSEPGGTKAELRSALLVSSLRRSARSIVEQAHGHRGQRLADAITRVGSNVQPLRGEVSQSEGEPAHRGRPFDHRARQARDCVELLASMRPGGARNGSDPPAPWCGTQGGRSHPVCRRPTLRGSTADGRGRRVRNAQTTSK